MFRLYERTAIIILITMTAAMGCTTEPPRSHVFKETIIIGNNSKIHSRYILELIADDRNPELLTSDESKIIFFREKQISTSRVFISINGYALASIGVGQSLSLKVPANRYISIGSGMLNAVGESFGITSEFSLWPDAKKAHYYRIQTGWKKSIIEKISTEEAVKYLDSGYIPVTPSYNIDWDVFLSFNKNHSPRYKSINEQGNIFAPRHDIMRYMF